MVSEAVGRVLGRLASSGPAGGGGGGGGGGRGSEGDGGDESGGGAAGGRAGDVGVVEGVFGEGWTSVKERVRGKSRWGWHRDWDVQVCLLGRAENQIARMNMNKRSRRRVRPRTADIVV